MRGPCLLSKGGPQTLTLTVTLISLRGCMEEAASRQQEEVERQLIDHPCSAAFQELRPRGVWCRGSIIRAVAQVQCAGGVYVE